MSKEKNKDIEYHQLTELEEYFLLASMGLTCRQIMNNEIDPTLYVSKDFLSVRDDNNNIKDGYYTIVISKYEMVSIVAFVNSNEPYDGNFVIFNTDEVGADQLKFILMDTEIMKVFWDVYFKNIITKYEENIKLKQATVDAVQ